MSRKLKSIVLASYQRSSRWRRKISKLNGVNRLTSFKDCLGHTMGSIHYRPISIQNNRIGEIGVLDSPNVL